MQNGLTDRVDLNVGYSCNERCQFCYYQDTMVAEGILRDLSTEECKRTLRYIRSQGKTVLDFTGGEPTIRKDFLELVRYAKEIGFKEVSCITNGVRFASPTFAAQARDAGLDDVLLSLHGADAATHDGLTLVPGSFKKALAALDNIRQLGVRYRTNCVVSGLNYDKLEPLTELYVDRGVNTVNFILFNPIVEQDANREHLNVAYSDAAPHLKRVIDRYGKHIDRLTVRYIPLCLMQGYEQYVTNMPQIQYDSDEWDYLVRTRIREGAIVSTVALGLGLLFLPDYGQAVKQGWQATKRDAIKRFLQHKNKVKGSACADCKYDPICDGVWREYAKWRGTGELVAIRGAKVRDPKHFRPDALNARGRQPLPPTV